MVSLHVMIFIDPATGWLKICQIYNKISVKMSQILNHTWLSRYPRPQKVFFDNGTEF